MFTNVVRSGQIVYSFYKRETFFLVRVADEREYVTVTFNTIQRSIKSNHQPWYRTSTLYKRINTYRKLLKLENPLIGKNTISTQLEESE